MFWLHKPKKKKASHILVSKVKEISLYIDSHLVGKHAKRIFSRRMLMVFGFGWNHTSENSVRAKYTIYLPSFLAAIHYYVVFPLVDILHVPYRSVVNLVEKKKSDFDAVQCWTP
jgi:hypothetical protein